VSRHEFFLIGCDANLRRCALPDVCTWKGESAMRTGFERAEKTVSQWGRFLLTTLVFAPVTALGQAQVPAQPEPWEQ
jgi:hypothetical protein